MFQFLLQILQNRRVRDDFFCKKSDHKKVFDPIFGEVSLPLKPKGVVVLKPSTAKNLAPKISESIPLRVPVNLNVNRSVWKED